MIHIPFTRVGIESITSRVEGHILFHMHHQWPLSYIIFLVFFRILYEIHVSKHRWTYNYKILQAFIRNTNVDVYGTYMTAKKHDLYRFLLIDCIRVFATTQT